MNWHPAANIFPLMALEEFNKLKDDIKEKGLLEPIIVYNEQIIDGRNRLKACHQLGIKPKFKEFDFNQSISEYVISKNLHRRHLNASQRAVVALEFLPLLEEEAKEKIRQAQIERRREEAKTKQSIDEGIDAISVSEAILPHLEDDRLEPENKEQPKRDPQSRDRAGKLLQVGGRYVQDAKKIVNNNEKLGDLIKEGKVNLTEAKEIIKLPLEVAEDIVDFIEGEEEITEREVKKLIIQGKKQERLEKISEIAKNNQELKSEKKYHIIYCDPPWKYDNNHIIGAAENHYPVMSEQELCELPVKTIAAADCVLIMWVTAPQLEVAMNVINSWGFQYKTCAVWNKNVDGTGRFRGYYFRMFHELILIATKGQLPIPESENRVPSIINHPYDGKHSKKPEMFYDLIEKMYPHKGLNKIELFARNNREGWDSWGNQTELLEKSKQKLD